MVSTAAPITALTTSLFRASEMLRRQVASFMKTLDPGQADTQHKCQDWNTTENLLRPSWPQLCNAECTIDILQTILVLILRRIVSTNDNSGKSHPLSHCQPRCRSHMWQKFPQYLCVFWFWNVLEWMQFALFFISVLSVYRWFFSTNPIHYLENGGLVKSVTRTALCDRVSTPVQPGAETREHVKAGLTCSTVQRKKYYVKFKWYSAEKWIFCQVQVVQCREINIMLSTNGTVQRNKYYVEYM